MRSLILLLLLFPPIIESRKIKLKPNKKRIGIRRGWRSRNSSIVRHLPGDRPKKSKFDKCMDKSERVIKLLGSEDTRKCLKNTAQVVAIASSIVAIGISIAGFIVAAAA